MWRWGLAALSRNSCQGTHALLHATRDGDADRTRRASEGMRYACVKLQRATGAPQSEGAPRGLPLLVRAAQGRPLR
jgi:hypothetical protein